MSRLLAVVSAMICALAVSSVSAVELLNTDQAIKRMFLTSDNVSNEVKKLSQDQLDKVKSLCGGKLYAVNKPSGVDESQYTFYFGSKAGAKQGVAVIENEMDEWGPLEFIIVLDPASGKIINAAMMQYVDARSRDLANRAFLKEFFGKGAGDPMILGKDIDGVTGATVSSSVFCHLAKKVAALYKVVYLK